MKVYNPSATQAVVIHDSLSNDRNSQFQPGIRDVLVSPLATVSIRNADAGQSKVLRALLLDRKLRIVDQTDSNPTYEVPGIPGGNGGYPFDGVLWVPAGKRLIIAFDSRYVPAVPAATDVIWVIPGYTKANGAPLALQGAALDYYIMNGGGLEGSLVVPVDAPNGGYGAVEMDNSLGANPVKCYLRLAA